MLRVLLAKDLRRAWRNPLPWLINLIVPLVMTTLIGLVFGGHSDNGALGRIRFALVDEDKSVLSDFLRGSSNQREGAKFLEPVVMEREEAMRQILDDKLSAVVIIPTNFMRNYLLGRDRVNLELIKNPAESVHPAVLEEMLGALVTALNAVARNFQAELPEWQSVFEGRPDYHQVAALIDHAGGKLEVMRRYLDPPLISYEKEASTDESKNSPAKGEPSKGGAAKAAPTFNIFAYLLVGMAGMFLLFLAGNGMSDLNRELRLRTFERYHTLHQQLLPFVAAKILFVMVMLLFCLLVMLGGGGLIFGIHWPEPLALAGLGLGYAFFAAGLMAVFVALVPGERHANALNTVVGMALGMTGGCFPPEQLPEFVRVHVLPFQPTYWFVSAVRDVQFSGAGVPWILVVLKLIFLSALLVGLAAFLFRRRFGKGLRS